MKTGNIFVISAPSGAGKSSLVHAICKKDQTIKVSISHTTRIMRPTEQNGIDYYFINQAEFENMLNLGEFLEHAEVFGNYYGTNKNTINKLNQNGYDIILEIDWQGAYQIKQQIPSAILIFILPPSITELEKRLRTRNTDSEEVIKERLALAQSDITHAKDFDVTIINDNFDKTVGELYSIILVHRLAAQPI
jgi:guanylate kinase